MVVSPLHGFDPLNPPAFDPTLIQGRVAVSHVLYDGGARGARVAGARGLEAASEAGLADVRAAALEELAEAFLGVLSARDVLLAERERVRELEAEHLRASQLFDEGAAPRLALLRAGSELSAARAEADAAQARVTLAESTLARRMGVPTESLASRFLTDVSPGGPTNVDQPEAPGVPPLVAAARERAGAAAARVTEAAAAHRPRLTATGALQEFGGGSSEFNTEWQGGLQIEYSIFNGGATRHAVELARAELREAEAQVTEAERAVADARDAAEAARVEALARSAALADAVASLEELVRVERLALEEGAGVQRDFLQAAASLAEARSGLAQARRASVLAEVRLARVSGALTADWLLRLAERGR
jgi:outer membrane protein TolC